MIERRRTDHGQICSHLAIHEVGGTWALYPHRAEAEAIGTPIRISSVALLALLVT